MTNYAGSILASPSNVARWSPGQSYEVIATYTLGTTIVTGDTITISNILPPLSNRVRIVSIERWGQKTDTNTTPTGTETIGDGTTANAYSLSSLGGTTAAGIPLFKRGDGANVGTQITVSRDIVHTIGGTLATAAASGQLFYRVSYICEGN